MSHSSTDVAVAVHTLIEGYGSQNTQICLRSTWNMWVKFLAPLAITEATEMHAYGFLKEQRGRGNSRFTVRRKIETISRVYRYLCRQKICLGDPTEQVLKTLPKTIAGGIRPAKVIPFEMISKILGTPDYRDAAIMALFFGGGLRISEVIKLKLEDICTTKRGTTYLNLWNPKSGGDVQKQVLPDQQAKIVKRYKKKRLSEGAVPSSPFIHHKEQHVCTKTIRKWFKKSLERVGLSDISPHSARATAITKLLNDGIPYREVQEFSRHSSISMVELYDKRRFSIDNSPAKKLRWD